MRIYDPELQMMHQVNLTNDCIVFVCEFLVTEWTLCLVGPRRYPETVNLFVSISYFRLLVKWSNQI